nr:GntR family transcriptional regulator [Microbacterium testaceum]
MSTPETYWPDEAFADLDRHGPVPLYFQVTTRLEKAIHSGVIPAGGRLENELAISERLRVSRPTVRRAIQELVDKGLLVRRRGVGTQVVQGKISRSVELTSLYDDLAGSADEPTTRVLSLDVRPAPEEVAAALGLEVDSDVVFLRRQRNANGVAVAVLVNYLPLEFADITSDQLEADGLYEILRRRGVTIRVARQKIGARAAVADEPGLLGIPAHSPVLTMQRVAFDGDGRAFEFGLHCYHPALYSFETTLVAR